MIDVLLAGVRYAGEGVRLFELAATSGRALPRTCPGSHLVLRLPNDAERPYFVSDRTRRGTVVIGVRRDPDGTASKYLHDKVRVGATLRIDLVAAAPLESPLDARSRVVAIAEDVGIFSAWPYLRTFDAVGCDWELHYDAWSRVDAALLDELRAFGPRVHVHVRSERHGEPPDWTAVAARIDDATHVVGAGTPTTAASIAKLVVRGGSDTASRVRWTSTVHERSRGAIEFEVVLARSGMTVPVRVDQSILDAITAAGIRPPHFCRGGICGTCRTRVLAGTPLHRDASLSDRERAANDVMMICRSRTLDERLVLDL